jgi:hypothetical protein
MLVIDLLKPPPLNKEWVDGFMTSFLRLAPAVPAVGALEHAVVAYESAWLLEPLEAAELWLAALRGRGWLPP